MKTGMTAGILVLALAAGWAAQSTPPAPDLAALQAELARLKGVVPDQAHAMADVGHHYANLWFAGDAANWPLAQFCLDETRSHLRWAVRIIPKRKDAEGREIDLGAILAALETSTFKDLDAAVKAKDKAAFATAYRAQLEGCMACHKASNKPYLRLRVPEKPDAGVLEFRPE